MARIKNVNNYLLLIQYDAVMSNTKVTSLFYTFAFYFHAANIVLIRRIHKKF